jgi:hypothetical protein
MRARFGIGESTGYFGGFDVRAGDLDGAHVDVDVHPVGIVFRAHGGGFLALTAGVGFGGVRGLGATHLPVELSVEFPVVGARVLFREALGWRLGGAHYASDVAGFADEVTALFGVRLGRERAWGKVTAGTGPYVAATYRNLGGTELFGIALGFDFSASD